MTDTDVQPIFERGSPSCAPDSDSNSNMISFHAEPSTTALPVLPATPTLAGLPEELLFHVAQFLSEDDLLKICILSRRLHFPSLAAYFTRFEGPRHTSEMSLSRNFDRPWQSLPGLNLTMWLKSRPYLRACLSEYHHILQFTRLVKALASIAHLEIDFAFHPMDIDKAITYLLNAIISKSCKNLEIKRTRRSGPDPLFIPGGTEISHRLRLSARLLQPSYAATVASSSSRNRSSLQQRVVEWNRQRTMDYTNPVSTLQTFSTWSLFPFCSPFCIWTIRSLNASSISRLSLYFGYPHYYGGPHWDRVLLHLNLPALEHLSIWSDSLSARPISVFLGRHPKIVTFHICGPVPRCLHSMRGKALQKMVSLRGSSSWVRHILRYQRVLRSLRTVTVDAINQPQSLTGVEAALRAIGRRDQPVDLAVVLPQYCGFWLEGSLRKTKVEATLRCVSKLRISFNSPQVLPDIVAALPGWLARLPALECVRIDDAVKEDDTDAKDALINAVMRACPRLRSCELSTAGVHAVVNGMVEHGSAESWVEQYPNPKLAPWPP